MEIVENVLSQEQIDELRRYETAKEFMSVIMGRANFDPINAPIMCCSCSGEKINPYSYIATISVQAADALLEALKGKGETDEVQAAYKTASNELESLDEMTEKDLLKVIAAKLIMIEERLNILPLNL